MDLTKKRILKKLRSIRAEIDELEHELDEEPDRVIPEECRPTPEDYAAAARRRARRRSVFE